MSAIDRALEDERRTGVPWTQTRAALEPLFEADWRRVGEYLREVARMPLFREAVLWQNRGALHTGIDALLRRPAGTMDSKTRQYEQLVASYLQRYCLKNDTIGFFGPVGWATLDETAERARVAAGPALVSRRTVYFEHWAIDRLATQLSQDRELRVSIAPRRMPTTRIEGARLHYPVDRVTTVGEGIARLLAACDGVRSAREIAEELIGDPATELATVDEVYDLLDELVESQIVIWRLEVPTSGFAPERYLRDALAGLEPSDARHAAEAALGDLVEARDRVARAGGSEVELDAALATLAETFRRVTDSDAERGAGQTYVGRGIVFEDCRRDAEVTLGRDFLERIGPPLALIEASARWFAFEVATRLRGVFEQLYRTLAAETGSDEVDFVRYYVALQPHLGGKTGASSTVVGVLDELQRRWTDILAIPAGTRRVELRVAELAPRVHAAFAVRGLGWPSARHHSPDLMIAASGPDALARGEFLVVLGELHAGVNAVTVPMFAKEHVDPERLYRARQLDVGRTIAAVEPRAKAHRARTYTFTDGDLEVEMGDTGSHRPRSDVFDVAGFVVVMRDDRLVVRRRDSSFERDIIEFLEADLTAESYTYDMFAPTSYRPRITVDGFVLAREAWRFPTAELAFARAKTPLERFVGARRWAQQHELPRYAFFKVRGEPKPVFLDFDSPAFVELFCKQVRGSEALSLSEMLPSFEQLWLPGPGGELYCSELRTVMVDPTTWSTTRP